MSPTDEERTREGAVADDAGVDGLPSPQSIAAAKVAAVTPGVLSVKVATMTPERGALDRIDRRAGGEDRERGADAVDHHEVAADARGQVVADGQRQGVGAGAGEGVTGRGRDTETRAAERR